MSTVGVDRVEAELNLYEATRELLPGSAKAMAKVWSNLGAWPADRLAEEVATRMASDNALVMRHRNPEFSDAKPDAAPVRRALARRVGQLREGAVDELTLAWGADLNWLPPGQIAKEVVRRLAKAENSGYLRERPPASPGEMRLAGILAQHFPEVDTVAFARDHARDFALMSEQQAVQSIASRMSLPVYARYLLPGNSAIAKGDPRLRRNPPLGKGSVRASSSRAGL